MARPSSPLRDFLAAETSGAICIAVAAVVALVWANSPLRGSYATLWSRDLAFTISDHRVGLDVHTWINDALMTIFFLLVGLEIKRELTEGHLAGRRAALAPVAAAMGGMVVPALVYLAIAGSTAAQGWAIPMATDIALAVGVVAVVGPRIPTSLRALLLGLAVVDDIGGIVVIAAVYSHDLRWLWLGVGALTIVLAALLPRLAPALPLGPCYVALGIALWLCLHGAHIHPTLAGVAIGLTIPMLPASTTRDAQPSAGSTRNGHRETGNRNGATMVERWEHVLHPWSSFLVVPLFALANSGIAISSHQFALAVRSPITWGIFLGLLVGKPLGVVLGTWSSVRTGVADPPATATRRQLVGIGTTAGIGFTVALFIAELAFTDEAHRSDAKLAILAASALAASISIVILRSERADSTVR